MCKRARTIGLARFFRPQKNLKNMLTKKRWSDSICKSSLRDGGKTEQFSLDNKKFKKLQKRCWQRLLIVVSYQSRRERHGHNLNPANERTKKFEKTLKKFLTKRKRSAKLNNRRTKRRVPCKLNNVTEKHEAPERIWLFQSFEKSLWEQPSIISLKLRLVSLNWLEQRKLFWYHFIESLILAQDERWRRA